MKEKTIYEVKPYLLAIVSLIGMYEYHEPYSPLGFMSSLLLLSVSAIILRMRFEQRILIPQKRS